MKNEIINISAENIYQHPDNPRKDLGDLEELSDYIKKKGIMQNLTVMIGHWDDKGKWQQDGYTLLIGHRRFAAGKMAAVLFGCADQKEIKEPTPITVEKPNVRDTVAFKREVSARIEEILSGDITVTVYLDDAEDLCYRGQIKVVNNGSDGTDPIIFIYADRKESESEWY